MPLTNRGHFFMQDEKPEVELDLKPKTVNYLNTSANTAEQLLTKAIEYRRLFDSSKTSVARELYAKKLKKVITKLDPYMKMFEGLQKAKQAKQVVADDEASVE